MNRTTVTGFTLIEILVSLSIIAILSSILYLSFDDARENSRTRALMAEVKEIQLALELYRSQNGSYPLPNATAPCGSPFPVGGERFSQDTGACSGSYIESLTPTFIAALPSADDSANNNCQIEYRTEENGAWYKLTARECVAGETIITVDDEMARCPSSCSSCDTSAMSGTYQASDAYAKSFAVYSLGGQCE